MKRLLGWLLLLLAAMDVTACGALVGVESLTVADAGKDAADAANCKYSPDFDASRDRTSCVQGCIEGHGGDIADFFIGNRMGNIQDCICFNCENPCMAFCNASCSTPNVPACNDCSSHVLVDDGGKCHSVQDVTCNEGGCESLSICIAQCPPT